ncbi:hypothetical protein HW532_15680 [Kaustia mangrovi]|uniref:Uncharacterized protein n=1 Tax=Kaustia mangrovi TaxID=2593653 RepID=A0A7S8C5Z0_9HYPH|nr:hypothetical protein [Kaustia mangrovi]QPC44003.1 hypothetical protein HW532_15680 [Kaustia mangrovi]
MNKTGAGDRVEKTRFIAMRPKELPAVIVYTMSETVADGSHMTAPRRLKRNLVLAIECLVALDETLPPIDEQLDSLAHEIEIAIHGDDTLGGIEFGEAGVDVWLQSTEIDVLPDGDRLYGVAKLSYNVEYYTYAPDANDVDMDEFQTADIEYNIEGQQDAADAAHDSLDDGLDGPEG